MKSHYKVGLTGKGKQQKRTRSDQVSEHRELMARK